MKRFTTRINEELKQKVNDYSKESGLKIWLIIQTALEFYFKRINK